MENNEFNRRGSIFPQPENSSEEGADGPIVSKKSSYSSIDGDKDL